MYEYNPDGLLRGLYALIVLALRCKLMADDGPAQESYCRNDAELLLIRIPWRGDGGHDDDCNGIKRERDELDFRRNIPAFVSQLQSPVTNILQFYFIFSSENW